MLAFGCSISNDEIYRHRAKTGLERVLEPDSRVIALSRTESVPRTYNLILNRAGALPGLEALVLMHEDAEIVDAGFAVKLRAALADPAVAVVGCVGASGVTSIAWWDGPLTAASAPYTHDGLELRWPREVRVARAPAEAVDTLYGVVLALSPWAIANLRFDEALGASDGHDFDICAQARAAGRKVVAADLRVLHHHAPEVVSDEERFIAAHIRAAEKWDTAPLTEAQWRARARRAEAAAGAARLLASSARLQADAIAAAEERHLEALRASVSWRLTEPLRVGNELVRRARKRWRLGAPSRRSEAS